MPLNRLAILVFVGLLVLGRAEAAGLGTPPVDEPQSDRVAPRIQAGPTPLEGPIDPETYRLGPGDELTLAAGGISDYHQVVLVSPEGTVRIPNLGVRSVSGMTLAEVRRRWAGELKRYFPRAPVEITLTHPRSFKVQVAGEVSRPGPVTLSGPARLWDALLAAGGTDGGPRRSVAIRRGGAVTDYDQLAYLRLADLSQSPLLEDGDQILVQKIRGSVTLFGGVSYAGSYELRTGEKLGRLLEIAGGYLPSADSTRLTVLRFRNAVESETLSIGSATGRPASEWAVEDGDRVFVGQVPHYHEAHTASATGEVGRPGVYPIVDGRTRLSDLLAQCGGLTAQADSERLMVFRPSEMPAEDTAYVNLLLRGSELGSFEREYARMRAKARAQISMRALDALKARGAEQDPVLVAGDVVVVPRRATSVMVEGQVMRPGLVAFRPGLDISDYVRLTGGFTRAADPGKVWVTLGATQQLVPADDVHDLRAGDVVWVPAREPGTLWGKARDLLFVAAQLATIYLVIHDATRSTP